MNIKYAQIVLAITAVLAGSSAALAQSAPAASSDNKPVIIDAAAVDNSYLLYEGDVVKVDKKKRTITFKNKEGESKFVAGSEITNFDQIKKGDHLSVTYQLAVAIELIKTKSNGIRSKVETNTVLIRRRMKSHLKPLQTKQPSSLISLKSIVKRNWYPLKDQVEKLPLSP